jgi:hypothetical protein
LGGAVGRAAASNLGANLSKLADITQLLPARQVRLRMDFGELEWRLMLSQITEQVGKRIFERPRRLAT